ncbi:hypothetical protein [Vannielia sp. SX4]|uniref:hypothetical protein n=1 Tax=Vannielia sp. SX4 TaxID=3463852 RepID=UPI00405830A5
MFGTVSNFGLRSLLLGATALVALPLHAQDGSGFAISIDGATVAGDPVIQRTVPRPDAQLAEADLRIQYDGLTVTPRLDLEIVGDALGPVVQLQMALNYPAFVQRAEILVYDATTRGAPRLASRQAVAVNGAASVTVPGDEAYAVLRVYDAKGRFNETAPLALHTADSRAREDGVEEGTDATARQGFRVYGGAVTVSGSSVAPGARVLTLGETIRPDASGTFVVQRILPPGRYPVQVAVQGGGQNVDIVRDITVPRSEQFYVATGDVTWGFNEVSGEERETYTIGRFAGYLNRRYASGTELTLQLDTGEGDIGDIFRDLDERDPRSVLLRVDPDDLYPTYGDDSTLVDDTPTSGKFYLRVERDNSYLTWGDFQADVNGGYLRNERTLYGFYGHYETPAATSHGEPRATVDVYAAQPERIAQRDVLRGTGGSVYFLRRQDIGIGTETVTIQIRDASTGRVLETRRLIAGQDYQINYIQGVVTLAAPLSSYGSGNGLVITEPGGSNDVNLVVNYEYSPTSTDVDTFAYGGRVEGWVSDKVRVGVTVMSEDTDDGDQRAAGVDLLWRHSENTFVSLDYAMSEGPGFSSNLSTDGGLVFDTSDSAGGEGEAFRLDTRVDLQDLGLSAEGFFAAYFERRTAGFSTLDYDTTSDEELWGVSLDMKASDRLDLAFYYDSYENDAGEHDKEGGVELEYALSQRVTLGVGLEHLDRRDSSDDGNRTDAAVRLTYATGPETEVYGYVQKTLSRSGDLSRNDRYGVGGTFELGRNWTLEGEISDGDLGRGGRLLFRHEKGEYETTYFGYELDPDRELTGVDLDGTDNGQFVFGGTRELGDGLTAFGENTYDMFGKHRALTSSYGAQYKHTDYLTYSGTFEYGQIRDTVNGDFERHALSLGVAFQNERTTASARLEYRKEDGSISGSLRDSETLLFVADARHEIDDARRLVFSLDASTTEGEGVIVESGDLVDLQLGYAFRPVDNEKLNVLFRYRYLLDTYGEQLDNDDEPGALQRTHVLSAEASYDLNTEWTLGVKVGARFSETAADADSDWEQNNATLAVANLRYHFVHNWDALLEVRAMHFEQTGTTEFGGLGAVYRQIGPNVKLGVGYNFGSVSSDLTDIEYDERGAFLNLVASF